MSRWLGAAMLLVAGFGASAQVAPPVWLIGTAACASCHAAPSGPVPRLAGLPGDDLVKQLQAWRDGHRRNSPEDLMNEAARGLTDSEIDALGRHLGAP